METIERTKSDISSLLLLHANDNNNKDVNQLGKVSEVEQAKCECCGMSEECTAEYIDELRVKYSGKLICGLCAEAVKEEMEKNKQGTREEALEKHMNACIKFNRIGRAYPVLYQAENVKKLLKKSWSDNSNNNNNSKKGGRLARSSSCIPAVAHRIDKLPF